MTSKNGVLLAQALALTGVLGCKDISRYSTAEGEAYCGQIVQGEIVRRGFSPTLRLKMTFDANNIGGSPGLLTTDDKMLDHVPLRPLPELSHDPLFTLDFGEGREK